MIGSCSQSMIITGVFSPSFTDRLKMVLWPVLERRILVISLGLIARATESFSAPYMMAKGVHYKVMHQYKKALEAFRTAHILDPRLTIAKNELQRLMQDLEHSSQHRDMLKEVTSVVENLFGKNTHRTSRKSG